MSASTRAHEAPAGSGDAPLREAGGAGSSRLAAVTASLERHPWRAIVVLTLVGGFLRVYGLGHWWLNADESIYFGIVIGDADYVRPWIARNAHPLLYYYLLRALGRVSLEPSWLRMGSVLAGTAVIPLVFLAGRRLGGTLTGIVVALLLTFSPGALDLSRVMRPYMLQLAFLALAVAALSSWLGRRRPGALALYSLALAVAVYLHYSSLVVLAGLAACLAGLALLRWFGPRDLVLLGAAQLPALLGLAHLWVIHLHPRLLEGRLQGLAMRNMEPMFVDGPGHALTALLGAARYGFGEPTAPLVVALVPVGLAWAAIRRRWPLLLLGAGILGAAVVLSALDLYPLGKSRHSIYLTLPLGLLAAFPLACALVHRSRTLRAAALVGIGVVAVGAAGATADRLRDRPSDEATTPREEAEALRTFLLGDPPPHGQVLLDNASRMIVTGLLRIPNVRMVPAGDGCLHTFAFGAQSFYTCFAAWNVPASRANLGKAFHLSGLLRSLPPSRPGTPIWIVSGGSTSNAAAEIPEALPDGRPIRSEFVGGEHLHAFRLHEDAYYEYLGQPPPRR